MSRLIEIIKTKKMRQKPTSKNIFMFIAVKNREFESKTSFFIKTIWS